MKKLIILSSIFLLNSCIWRTVECRAYKLNFEEYWIQGEIGISSITMKDSQRNIKNFLLKDKWIAHTDNYTSDTGCSCNDQSAQLICIGNDSIWMFTNAWYIEKADAEFNESVSVIINGISSSFSEKDMTSGTELISSTTILTRIYESSSILNGAYSITFAKGIGPIRIKFTNGDIWEIDSPQIKETSPISTYRYETIFCD